jgi:hypothetical protein
MTRETVRIFAIVSVIVLIQSSCASEEANYGAIAVKELVRSSKSWEGTYWLRTRKVSPRLQFGGSVYLREHGSRLTVIR